MPEFSQMIAQKNILPNFRGLRALPAAVSNDYDSDTKSFTADYWQAHWLGLQLLEVNVHCRWVV